MSTTLSEVDFLDSVPNRAGYAIIEDGLVVQSDGELEHVPDPLLKQFIQVINAGTSNQVIPDEKFHSVSINFMNDYSYTLTVVGKRIVVIKQNLCPTENDSVASVS